MGLSLSALLTGATNARAGYEEGQQGARKQASDDALKNAITQLTLKRQQDRDAVEDAFKKSQMTKMGAETSALQNRPAPRDPVKDHAANRDYDLAHPAPTPATPQQHVIDPVTGEVTFFDPMKPPTGLKVHPAPKQDTFAPVTLGGDEGTPPVIKPFNTHTGAVGEPIGTAKPTTTKIESATNTAAKARLEAAISEMNNAHSGMSQYEQKLATGQTSINGLQQFIGATGSSFTHDDPASRAIQAAALATLNAQNPELARYIRRGLSFAEGESMISNRPSDFRTKMSAFLATAGSGASPDMIHDIQSRRTSLLNPLNNNVAPVVTAPKGGGRGGGAGGETEAAWAAKNPPAAGESFEAYHARYLKAHGGA